MTAVRWLLLVTVWSSPVWAEETISDRDLRSSAERILSDPAFQSFDRFPKGTNAPAPTPSSSSSTSSPTSTSSPAGEEAHEPAPSANWWDRLRQQGQNKTSSNRTENSSSSGTSSDSRANEDRPNPTASKDAAKVAPPEKAGGGDIAPQRPAGPRSTPAKIGQDGVTRPVRFAPKVRPPEPSRGPDWNLDLGWMSGFGTVLGSVLHLLAYAVVIGVCVLIIVLVAQAIAEYRRHRSPKLAAALSAATPLAHDRSPGETEADIFLREALRLAESGAYRPALAQLVLGAMSTIERRQWIRYRRGLTLNDYLRSVRSRPDQLTGLWSVIDSYEPVEFGRRHATDEQFSTALAGYRQAFTSLEATLPG